MNGLVNLLLALREKELLLDTFDSLGVFVSELFSIIYLIITQTIRKKQSDNTYPSRWLTEPVAHRAGGSPNRWLSEPVAHRAGGSPNRWA